MHFLAKVHSVLLITKETSRNVRVVSKVAEWKHTFITDKQQVNISMEAHNFDLQQKTSSISFQSLL